MHSDTGSVQDLYSIWGAHTETGELKLIFFLHKLMGEKQRCFCEELLGLMALLTGFDVLCLLVFMQRVVKLCEPAAQWGPSTFYTLPAQNGRHGKAPKFGHRELKVPVNPAVDSDAVQSSAGDTSQCSTTPL